MIVVNEIGRRIEEIRRDPVLSRRLDELRRVLIEAIPMQARFAQMRRDRIEEIASERNRMRRFKASRC